MDEPVKLDGLVPDRLAPRTRKVVLEDLALNVEIGFHDFEIGRPQRLLVGVEVWLEATAFAATDRVADAWDYDHLRSGILGLAEGRRFNLQETLVREIYDLVAARKGVAALRVASRKPDVYPDCAGVGVELASF
jgi:dihydroneopterin aldolase